MKLFLALTCLLIFSFQSSAQEISTDSLLQQAAQKQQNREYAEAIALYEKAYSILKTEDRLYNQTIYGLAENHYNQRNYDQAIEFYLRCLEVFPSNEQTRNTLRRINGRLGYIYLYIKVELKKAKAFLDDENELLIQLDTLANVRDRFRNSYNLASVNRLLNDHNTGLNHGFQALDAAQKTPGNNKVSISFAYSVIANVLAGMNAYDEANEYYLKKIEVSREIYGPNHVNIANDYNNIGLTYLDAKNYEAAETYLKKALNILEKDTENKRFLSNTYNHLGATYLKAGKTNESQIYLNKAADISNGMPIQESLTYENQALLQMELGAYDSALLCYQKALGAIIPEFKWTTIEDNPTPSQLFTEPFYYELLNSKASCWLEKYKAEQDTEALNLAYKAFQIMFELTDDYRNNFSLESSRLFFQNWNYGHYADAMEAIYYQYSETGDEQLIGQAWTLIEKNKSLLMLENLLSAERVEDLEVPDSLINVQNGASAKIWSLERDLKSCSDSGNCNDSTIISLRKQLADAGTLLEESRQSIRVQAPDYYQLTWDEEIWPLDETSKLLQNEAVMINYFNGKDAYYLLATDGRNHILHRVEKTEELQQSIIGFLADVSGSTLAHGNLKDGYLKFTENAHMIYHQLVLPIVKMVKSNKLIIVPDGLLALLPFEALISTIPDSGITDYSSLPYLINKMEIGYGYSATLWSNNQRHQSLDSEASLVAFGTSEMGKNKMLADLPGSRLEVNALSNLSNSMIRLDAQATESNFKEAAQNSEIIHLAVHNLNDQNNPLNSKLVFTDDGAPEQDGNLHMYELYGMKMNPSLVVLSACETGVAEWQQGEGAYHMGRGFLYHGNPALVLSLWKVRDAAAANLMKSFYDAIDEGLNSVSALRAAKLNYLNQADELTSHPSNWAAFIGVGDVEKSAEKERLIVLFGTISLLLVVALIIFRGLGLKKPIIPKIRGSRN